MKKQDNHTEALENQENLYTATGVGMAIMTDISIQEYLMKINRLHTETKLSLLRVQAATNVFTV